jgi:cholest-4-en-3-one 26-monooxygenase
MTVRQEDILNAEIFQRRDHHEVFARLRAEDPVHWNVDSSGHGYWCLTKHADVTQANRDIETFAVTSGFTLMGFDDNGAQDSVMSEMLPGMAPERHARYRRIVSRGFTPRSLGLLEDHLRIKAKVIVDNVIQRGHADFVDDIAAELPLQAICELVGVDEEDRRKIFAWGNIMTGIDDPNIADKDAGMVASAEMIGYADALRLQRETSPAEDIITKLTNAEFGDEKLTAEEFGMFFILLVVAGNETTRNATAHGMRALLENPAELHELASDPSEARMKRAVEEILRWSSPVHYFRRTATRDVELRGRTIKQGDWVVLWYTSANRDEEVFPDAFVFDVSRENNEHVAFGGGGPHFCLGANLARLELRLIFTELVTRLSNLRLDGDVEMLRSNFIAGITKMPVRWDPPTVS